MAVLEFSAVDFDDCLRAAKQTFRRRFYNSRLARTGRAKEQKRSDWAIRRAQSADEHLITPGNLPNRFILANNAFPQVLHQDFSLRPHPHRVQLDVELRHISAFYRLDVSLRLLTQTNM